MFLPLVQVATDGAVAVVGGLDVRLPKQLTGIQPDGVPPHDEGGCFVANVVVSEDARGRGIGSALMEAAMKTAQDWGATAMYTQVEAGNKVGWSMAQQRHWLCTRSQKSSVGKAQSLLNFGADLVLQS